MGACAVFGGRTLLQNAFKGLLEDDQSFEVRQACSASLQSGAFALNEFQSLNCRAPCPSSVAQIDGSIMDGRAEFKQILLRAEVWRYCLQPPAESWHLQLTVRSWCVTGPGPADPRPAIPGRISEGRQRHDRGTVVDILVP